MKLKNIFNSAPTYAERVAKLFDEVYGEEGDEEE
jgi:hypothetical protein|tara:strand:- start:11 stop:112 length:102 start_codon:yes stop_codon:yes gene_type:complete